MKRNCTKLSMIGAGLLLSLPLAAQTTETAPATEDTKPTWSVAPTRTETRRIIIDTTDGDRRVRIERTIVNGKVQHSINVDDRKALGGSLVSDTVVDDGTKKVRHRISIRSLSAPQGTSEQQDAHLRFETDEIDGASMLKVEIDGSTLNLEGIEEGETFDMLNIAPEAIEPLEEIEDIEEMEEVSEPVEINIVEPSEDLLMDVSDQGSLNKMRIRVDGNAPHAAAIQFKIDGPAPTELTPEQNTLHEQMEKAAVELTAKEKALNDLMESESFTPEQRKRIATARGAIDSARYLLRQAEKNVRSQQMIAIRKRFDSSAPFCVKATPSTLWERAFRVPTPPPVHAVPPAPPLPAMAAMPPLPPMPPDRRPDLMFIGQPETIFLSADSVSVVNSAKGECEIRVYNLGKGSKNLVINEISEEGKPSHITLYSGVMTIMNGGGKRTKIFDVAGDSLVADVDRKVVVIAPGDQTVVQQEKEIEVSPDIDREETAAVSTASDNTGCRLADAVPNPTEGTVSFSFTLPKSQRAAVTIHDQNGRLIETVRDGMFDAGNHTLMFDAGNLPNGTYFYRLTSGSFVASKALHVVK